MKFLRCQSGFDISFSCFLSGRVVWFFAELLCFLGSMGPTA